MIDPDFIYEVENNRVKLQVVEKLLSDFNKTRQPSTLHYMKLVGDLNQLFNKEEAE